MATLLQRLGWGRPHHREPPPSVHFKDHSNAGIPKGITDGVPKGFNDNTNHQNAEVPPPLGPSGLVITPWSVSRLDAIATAVIERPDQAALESARSARTCLSRLWLATPVDGLEALFEGPVGAVYQKFLKGVLPALPLDAAETAWKTSLSEYLLGGFERSGSLNVLLALLPYIDREGLQVTDPFHHLPSWLLPLYAERCDPAIVDPLEPTMAQNLPRLQPGRPMAAIAASPLPILAPITGDACMALIGDAAFLGRVSALINLFAIDPHDPEVGRDLNRSRRQVAQVWLDVQADQLESLYRTPFGQLTDNLIASDFAKEPLGSDDITMRHQLAQVASDLRDPHALNALMAALLYYPIKQVKLPATKDLLPPWLSQGLSRLGANLEGD